MPEGTGSARVYYNVSLIDCASPELLNELRSSLGLDAYVICQVSERTVLVNSARKTQLARALSRRGLPFRIVDLPPMVSSRAEA